MQKMSLHEAMYTQRAIRNFTLDPVSDEVVTTILDAAVRAPNGGNTQRWSFLVIRDRETKKRFGEWYLDAWTGLVTDMNLEQTSAQPYRSSMLTQNMEDIPVLIWACLDSPTRRRQAQALCRSHFPRVLGAKRFELDSSFNQPSFPPVSHRQSRSVI